MTKNVKISVVVVCKNENNYAIVKTFNSIIGQSYQNIEIVCIDGNSHPITKQSLSKYQDYFDYFISEIDDGIFDAMNKGINHSTGDYLIFMNVGDSFYSENTIADIISFISTSKESFDILYGHSFHEELGIRIAPKYISKYSLLAYGICHQAMLIKSNLFESIGLYDTCIGIAGDPEWNLRAESAKVSFKHTELVICNYKGGGISANSTLVISSLNFLKGKYLNRRESFFFLLYNIYVKSKKRIKTKNFRIPFSILKNKN